MNRSPWAGGRYPHRYFPERMGWPNRAHPTESDGHIESVALGVGAAGTVLVGCYWLACGLAGWTVGHRWPSLPLAMLPSALHGLPAHLADPLAAWAHPVWRPAAGAGLAFYLWLLAILAVSGTAVWWGWRRLRLSAVATSLGPARRVIGPPAGWARPGDIGAITIGRPRPGRLVLGALPGRRRRLVAAEARHSVLVIGPTQSGKTTGMAIPSLLEWPGPVVATSVKDDLAAQTLGWRSRLGPCAVFDPTRTSGLSPLSRWSPLSACDSWSSAQRMASWLVESTPGRRGLADAAFWYTTAAKQLAPLMLAAASAGMGLSDVVRWTNSGEFGEPLRLLDFSGEVEASLALAACAGREERIRSSISTTLETVLAPLEDPVVAASTAVSDIDVADVLASNGSLYLCGPSHEQARVQGLFAALVSTVVAEAIRRVGEQGGPLDPPLLLVLDEAANIAPIRDLDTLASTGAGAGIQLVTVCQDLAQLAARYDPERARTIANNHRAKLLLSGVSDLGTLDLMSGLAGETAVREVSISEDLNGGRGRSRQTSTVLRRLAPADQLRRLPPGEAMLVYGHLPPARIKLRPYYLDGELRRRAATGR